MNVGLLAFGVGSSLAVALSPWNSVVSTPALFLVKGFPAGQVTIGGASEGKCPRVAKMRGSKGNKLNQIRRPSPKVMVSVEQK